MKEVYLITKNTGKLLAAQAVFSRYNICIKNIDKDYPEIQAHTSIEVARHMALQAAKEFGVPVVREDHSICLHAMNGMPGPFMSWFDKNVPVEKLIELLNGVKDRDGFFELAAAYALPTGKVKEYVYRVPITISTTIRGTRGNWDKVIVLKNKPEKTLGETQEKDNVEIWTHNYLKIAEYISKQT